MTGNNCLNFEILDIVRTKRRKTYFPLKNIGTYLLSIRLSGDTVFLPEDGKFTLSENDVFYVPMGSRYSQYDLTDVEYVCFHLEIRSNAPAGMIRVSPEDKGKIRRMFTDAAAIWQKKKDGYAYECTALLYNIFAATIAPVISREQYSANPLARSIAYMNSHLFEPELSLSDVCRESGISRVYFNRLFMEHYGTTPVKYINHKRIEKARLLLKSGSFSREEIALLCGFKDVKYFYTVFKNVTGITTGEYCRRVSL